nr:hypothetical protein [Tanacetum cinerariifolium]
MADKEKKSTMKGFVTNDKQITIEGVQALRLMERMHIFTKGALWDYWKLGSDEVEPTNEKTFSLEETKQDDEQEIDLDVYTNDIAGFKTYDEDKDDWVYEWNKNMPWSRLPIAGEKMDIVMEETYQELT